MENRAIESVEKSLLQEAAEWRLIGLLFECPSEGWLYQASALAAEIADDALKTAVETIGGDAVEGIYHSTFGPGGPAPPREIGYRDWVEPGQLMSELSAFYQAFSYTPTAGEAPDHVAVETGFVAYLKLKEAYARACGDDEHAAITREAAHDFIAGHLRYFAEPLAGLLGQSGVDYLNLTAQALLRRTGPSPEKPKPADLPVIPNNEDSVFDCA